MIFAKIALGLFGLGIVVFMHELGHFLAARLTGVDVEAFSIGWGNPILKKKIGKVEYRLGMFPVGGYCKMRGEHEFREVWENSKNGIPPDKGTFLGTSPLRRIIISFAGPFFNVIFAVLVLSIIWGAGFEVQTLGNKIVLASEMKTGVVYPADEAGLMTGDRIVAINGKKTNYYHEVQENIAINPGKLLSLTVDRRGEALNFSIKPELDKSTGAGRIGVYFWADPVIAGIVPDSDAAAAGLMPGDLITAVNGQPVTNSIDFLRAMEDESVTAAVDYTRNGTKGSAEIVLAQPRVSGLGIIWPNVKYHTPRLSPPAAVAKGAAESWKTLVVSLRSLSLLFKGIELTEAISGPVRITYMVGEAATAGFGQSIGTGLRSMADFLALISIALCVMNLLPLPVLDGGLIILSIVEIIRRKPLHPNAVKAFQAVGVILIFTLMAFALFGDILYLARK